MTQPLFVKVLRPLPSRHKIKELLMVPNAVNRVDRLPFFSASRSSKENGQRLDDFENSAVLIQVHIAEQVLNHRISPRLMVRRMRGEAEFQRELKVWRRRTGEAAAFD
jgi:hypothetical protein